MHICIDMGETRRVIKSGRLQRYKWSDYFTRKYFSNEFHFGGLPSRKVAGVAVVHFPTYYLAGLVNVEDGGK